MTQFTFDFNSEKQVTEEDTYDYITNDIQNYLESQYDNYRGIFGDETVHIKVGSTLKEITNHRQIGVDL